MNSLVLSYDPQKLLEIDVRLHERQVTEVTSLLCMCKELAAQEQCASLVAEDGTVVAILGYIKLWQGCLEVFIVPSEHVAKYAKGFVQAVKHHLAEIQERENAHRLQTASWAELQTDSWMSHLGFTCEGTLRQYTKNRLDYRMWAKYGQ